MRDPDTYRGARHGVAGLFGAARVKIGLWAGAWQFWNSRRTLDDTWRQVLRRLGANPEDHIGPRHDALLDEEQAW